ncbi:MAG: hypothetical protein ABSD71_14600 [Bacteroidales bacterium]
MFTRCLFLIVFLFSVFSFSLLAQEEMNLSAAENLLVSIEKKILKTDNDSVRQSLNLIFKEKLRTTLELPGSFSYPFDSLKKLAKLTSQDKKFRIYNWNIPISNGSNLYFCFFQIQEKSNKALYKIIELRDRSDSIPEPEHSNLSSADWYGALYYKLITEKTDNGKIYTLLGWEGKDLTEMQKIIEIVTFDENDLPHFGKAIFNKYKTGQNKRVIFRYSPVSSMVLRYEEQTITQGKNGIPLKRNSMNII